MKNALCLIILVFIPVFSFAQSKIDTNQLMKIKLVDESIFYGTIKSKDNKKLILQCEDIGRIEIENSDVVYMKSSNGPSILNDIKLRNYYNNYVYSESAIMPKKGSGYYSNLDLVFANRLGYGLSNYFTIEGGVLFHLFSPDPKYSSNLGIKAGYPINKYINIASKAQYFYLGQNDNLALLSAYSTFGNVSNNLTLGIHMGKLNYYDYLTSTKIGANKNYYSVASTVSISSKITFTMEYFIIDRKVQPHSIFFNYNKPKFALVFGMITYNNDYSFDYDSKNNIPIFGMKFPL